MMSSTPDAGADGGGSVVMETSNFAHVIFQNVGKSFLPQAALECHYTLTPFITPHPKDWVGIFKVGWSSARDYYTFLWSPMPENYRDGSTVHRTLIFQGYYVPRSDGEFYQFCYVTHTGEIRGASTPFQFRPATPTGEELLTVEDDGNSDILVVTTKTGLLEQRIEEVQQECRELQKSLRLLTQERDQLQDEQRRHRQELQQELREEKEAAQARVRQLEQDLLEVTQRAVLKETEMDSLRDRLQKAMSERDGLEAQLKNERDEKELYKSHVRSAELENTKLSAELQMLKAVELNREVTIAQYQEELHRLRAEREAHTHPTDTELKEQLRKAEEQLEASRQQAALLGAELQDTSSGRDRTMADLYRARVEADTLRASLADAQAECQRMESQLDRMRSSAVQDGDGAVGGLGVVSEMEAELQKEVEELKLRLQMAAEHYKEKYRECQRLHRQVTRLTHQQEQQQLPGQADRNDASTETAQDAHTPPVEDPAKAASLFETQTLTRKPEAHDPAERGWNGEETEEEDKKEENGESDEEEEEEEGEESSVSVEVDLAQMEEKWREQCTINDNLKLLLASEEQRFKAQISLRDGEVASLTESLADMTREKDRLEEELRLCLGGRREEGAGGSEPVVLRYPLPYPQNAPPPQLIPHCPAELQYGNPYSSQQARDGADGALSPEQNCRPPPLAPPPWGGPVVCMQPSRSLSPPDGLENPPEECPSSGDGEAPAACDHHSPSRSESRSSFCFDSRPDVHKRCPLCEVIFPPHFEQRSFERHVESHWKVCPVCSEQFPLDCQQHLYEKHVLTHFDGNVLNFDNVD